MTYHLLLCKNELNKNSSSINVICNFIDFTQPVFCPLRIPIGSWEKIWLLTFISMECFSVFLIWVVGIPEIREMQLKIRLPARKLTRSRRITNPRQVVSSRATCLSSEDCGKGFVKDLSTYNRSLVKNLISVVFFDRKSWIFRKWDAKLAIDFEGMHLKKKVCNIVCKPQNYFDCLKSVCLCLRNSKFKHWKIALKKYFLKISFFILLKKLKSILVLSNIFRQFCVRFSLFFH